MYIALKPIHFDKWYQVGDVIPENVIHSSQRKRILATGRVACVNGDLKSSSVTTEEPPTDEEVSSTELKLESPPLEKDESSAELAEEISEENTELPIESTEEPSKKKTGKKTTKKISE